MDKIFAWADGNSPGCACAVAKDGNLEINRGNGMADLDYFSDDPFRIHFISPDSFDLVSMDGYILSFSRAKAWKPDEKDCAALVGTYHSDESVSSFKIVAVEGQQLLSLNHAPQRRFPLMPIARDRFQLSQMFIQFTREENGKVVAMDYSNPLLRRLQFIRSNP